MTLTALDAWFHWLETPSYSPQFYVVWDGQRRPVYGLQPVGVLMQAVLGGLDAPVLLRATEVLETGKVGKEKQESEGGF